jgi:hypothetical protein
VLHGDEAAGTGSPTATRHRGVAARGRGRQLRRGGPQRGPAGRSSPRSTTPPRRSRCTKGRST